MFYSRGNLETNFSINLLFLNEIQLMSPLCISSASRKKGLCTLRSAERSFEINEIEGFFRGFYVFGRIIILFETEYVKNPVLLLSAPKTIYLVI